MELTKKLKNTLIESLKKGKLNLFDLYPESEVERHLALYDKCTHKDSIIDKIKNSSVINVDNRDAKLFLLNSLQSETLDLEALQRFKPPVDTSIYTPEEKAELLTLARAHDYGRS